MRNRARLGICFVALLASAGCGDDDSPSTADAGAELDARGSLDSATPPPPSPLDAATRPDGARPGPSVDSITGLRRWYVVGNALTPGNDLLRITVAEPDVESIRAEIDGAPIGELTRDETGHVLEHDLTGVATGEHELSLFDGDAVEPWATLTFVRSHPFYVVVSNDWDAADNGDEALQFQELLHDDHPELLVTHLVGPYTFTDTEIAPERVRLLLDWLEMAQADWQDEIGLHIHPYCSFVDTTSVPCRTTPTYARSFRGPGYTVPSTAYTEEEYLTLLRAADDLFVANGLPKPTAFRAGAWAADTRILRALAADGFLADSSAANWARLEEWEGQPFSSLYEMTMTLWAPIGDQSQPYYPSQADPAVAGSPHVGILELPDNGILADYVSAEEMIEILGANWEGGPLDEPRALSIGYHPTSLDATVYGRLDDTLAHIDARLAAFDGGPIVYARMSDMAQVWTAP